MQLEPFKCYEEIPAAVKEYILTVADAFVVEQIPLEDINEFLAGYAEYKFKQAKEEWEDGWVL